LVVRTPLCQVFFQGQTALKKNKDAPRCGRPSFSAALPQKRKAEPHFSAAAKKEGGSSFL
jgi:hypothetical protein